MWLHYKKRHAVLRGSSRWERPYFAITGIYASKLNGDYIQVNAKAVVLAGGGFANNREYVTRGGWGEVDRIINAYAGFDGDGTRMVIEAGGADSLDRFAGMFLPTISNSLAHYSGVMGPGNDGITKCARTGNALWVNETGNRFCSENAGSVNYQALGIPLAKHKITFSIFDQVLFEQNYSLMPAPFLTAEETQAQMDERIEKNPDNDTFRADTIEDLAKQVAEAFEDMDANTLVSTFNRYNEICANGEDEDFAKESKFLVPMTNPPYYCVAMYPYLVSTFGGIHTNRSFECVTPENKPIAGLYAVGAESSELWPNVYILNVPGGANANNVNSGRKAAQGAAEYIGDSATGQITEDGDTSASKLNRSWNTPDNLIDGAYTATVEGRAGDITATVTIAGGKIADVTETNKYETMYIGTMYMDEKVIPAVIEAGSLDVDIDVVGGATISCCALLDAVEDCLTQATK